VITKEPDEPLRSSYFAWLNKWNTTYPFCLLQVTVMPEIGSMDNCQLKTAVRAAAMIQDEETSVCWPNSCISLMISYNEQIET
jgi:hypothetical protein